MIGRKLPFPSLPFLSFYSLPHSSLLLILLPRSPHTPPLPHPHSLIHSFIHHSSFILRTYRRSTRTNNPNPDRKSTHPLPTTHCPLPPRLHRSNRDRDQRSLGTFLSVCLSVCLFVHPSVHPSIWSSVSGLTG